MYSIISKRHLSLTVPQFTFNCVSLFEIKLGIENVALTDYKRKCRLAITEKQIFIYDTYQIWY